jgi:hypothetical protein
VRRTLGWRGRRRSAAGRRLMPRSTGQYAGKRWKSELELYLELLLDDVRDRVGIATYEQSLPVLRQFSLDALADDVERRISSAA